MSNSFQDLMKQLHRKDDVKATDATLCVFDILPLVEFKQGHSTLGQKRRMEFLNNFENIFSDVGCVNVVPYVEVDLADSAGYTAFQEFNRLAIEQGFEGIMIKDPNAKYECKRSASWLKQKPFIEVSLAVVDVEAGTGRNEGRLGALVCEGTDDGKLIRVNVGSGFSDGDRDDFWLDRERVMGQIVEVRADAVTQNQDGSYSLRFPRFLRFRGFDRGEKL